MTLRCFRICHFGWRCDRFTPLILGHREAAISVDVDDGAIGQAGIKAMLRIAARQREQDGPSDLRRDPSQRALPCDKAAGHGAYSSIWGAA
jgi:hypothetical protein